ncbi:hypothetical protein B0O99DRAFT_637974 [Bisporella sp. PMI_857]|nr:hypothetical protein B0O99DRAFT_637974 [Bisporella sp. PMI_857]
MSLKKQTRFSKSNGISTTLKVSLLVTLAAALLTDQEIKESNIPVLKLPEVNQNDLPEDTKNKEVKNLEHKWIHGVKRIDYEHLKNRFDDAIEVLVAGPRAKFM